MKIDYICHSGSDLLVVNAARVSFGKHKDVLDDADIKLLHYLARHRPPHWTPFAQPQLTVRVTAPIFVSRQMEKHIAGLVMGTAAPVRNEISRRYVQTEPDIHTPIAWRARPRDGIKQGSGGPLDAFDQTTANTLYAHAIDTALQTYQELLGLGVAPEQARMVLPQAAMTEWVWTGSLYAFFRIVELRLAPDAQAESREIARQLDGILKGLFPQAYGALVQYATAPVALA